jgi:UDPglucose--hexose-1-phosphate uridylyltransferase
MAKYVPDISSHRWVLISPTRLARPDDHVKKKKKKICPFCPGHESMTPPEVLRYGNGQPNTPGWEVRVVPNKFSITDIHEVIIHSPHCDKDVVNLPLSHIELIFKAYRERYNFYRKHGQVLIFCNHGAEAGASLTHPHSQLVVIPSQINLDTLSREPLNNIVDQNKFFHVYCPDFSQWPYEVWIAAKDEKIVFGNISDEQITDLSQIMQKSIKQLEKIYHTHQFPQLTFTYNYYIYPKENWYLRIIPRFVYRAGFELGTGLSVNIIDPINAALELKGIDSRTGEVLRKLRKHV